MHENKQESSKYLQRKPGSQASAKKEAQLLAMVGIPETVTKRFRKKNI